MSRKARRSTVRSRSYEAIAEYYDAEYESNQILDNDVPFMLQHLPKRSQSVLELCCGTGRAAIPIAQSGHRVVGVDYDANLLEIARRKRDSVGIEPRQLDLVRGNVLTLKLGKTFDFAFLIFNTFLNFTTADEQDQLLDAVVAHLKPRGRFWIDIFYPDLTILAAQHHAHFDSATFYVPSLDRSVHRVTEIERSADRPQVQRVTFHYTWASTDGRINREKIEFDMTWMFPRELERLLHRHGFFIEQMYGDYDGSAVTPESSRIIVLVKKG
ncbi:MAG: methyltransferase domain-containing protein [Burkholderiales bacterium]|nr:methyltransferase domain-containing protein [Phycisphaerae bacterium]